jgi:uncharacterized protein YndB with AHSA1/START domain
MSLIAKAAIQIQKPIEVVFEAIVNPDHMCQYFIEKSSGRMVENEELIWKWPEFDENATIKTGQIIKNQYISFVWMVDDHAMKVEINLTGALNDSTIVQVTEKERNMDEAGVKWLAQNTEGWANFLACLKAYVEYGIHLRQGAFDFLRPKTEHH